MTLAEFSQIYAVLAMQLNDTNADEAKIRGYYRAMSDLEVEFVALAAERLAHTAEWFPKTSEWRAAARRVERDRDDELRARLKKLQSPLCRACEDTGWRASGPENRFMACECRNLRRLEVLGRRPMSALPAQEPAGDPTQFPKAQALIKPLLEAK